MNYFLQKAYLLAWILQVHTTHELLAYKLKGILLFFLKKKPYKVS